MKGNIILMGTPGSGKTVLLRLLEKKGYAVVEEAATDLIALEHALGKKAPWKKVDFIDQIIDLQRQREKYAARNSSIRFFDRSPICTYALCQFLGYNPTPRLLKEIDRINDKNVYHRKVFFIKNLGFVKKTAARTIDYEEAVEFEALHFESYHQFGYECIPIHPTHP